MGFKGFNFFQMFNLHLPTFRASRGEITTCTPTWAWWGGRRCKLDPGLKAPLVSKFDCENGYNSAFNLNLVF